MRQEKLQTTPNSSQQPMVAVAKVSTEPELLLRFLRHPPEHLLFPGSFTPHPVWGPLIQLVLGATDSPTYLWSGSLTVV